MSMTFLVDYTVIVISPPISAVSVLCMASAPGCYDDIFRYSINHGRGRTAGGSRRGGKGASASPNGSPSASPGRGTRLAWQTHVVCLFVCLFVCFSIPHLISFLHSIFLGHIESVLSRNNVSRIALIIMVIFHTYELFLFYF